MEVSDVRVSVENPLQAAKAAAAAKTEAQNASNGAGPNVPMLRSVVVVRYNTSRTKHNWLIK